MEVRTTDPPRVSAIEAFEALPEGTRAELIDGEIVMMAAPVLDHQRIEGRLHYQLFGYLLGKRCEVFAESELQLSEAKDEVFKPDLMVVCDRSKSREKRVVGVPDLIIEILSPSTASHDCVTKLNRYLDAGVREYWIVSPGEQTIVACRAIPGQPAFTTYTRTDRAPVAVLEGCEIDLSLVFPAPATQSPEE